MSELYKVHHVMSYNLLAKESPTELTMERVRLEMMQAAQTVFDEDLGKFTFILTFDEDGCAWYKGVIKVKTS